MLLKQNKLLICMLKKKKYKNAYNYINLLIKRVISKKITTNIIKELSTLPKINLQN